MGQWTPRFQEQHLAVACSALELFWAHSCHPQKAPGIIGRAAETDAQRAARLYGMLQDFGEADLVLA